MFWGDFFTSPPHPLQPGGFSSERWTGPRERSVVLFPFWPGTQRNVNNRLCTSIPVWRLHRLAHRSSSSPAARTRTRPHARPTDIHDMIIRARARSRSLNNSHVLVRFKSNCCRVIYAVGGNECGAHAYWSRQLTAHAQTLYSWRWQQKRQKTATV